MADLVRFTLDDGSLVVFESVESGLVARHGGGQPDVVEGGALQVRLAGMAEAAQRVAASLRSRLEPEEFALEFGVKVSGELNWWFFAKNAAEGTIKVTVKWRVDEKPAPDHARAEEAGEPRPAGEGR